MSSGLTKLQLETLTLIGETKVRDVNCGYGAWRILGANPSTVGKLVKAGLAKQSGVNNWYELTPAGRQALKEPTNTTEETRS